MRTINWGMGRWLRQSIFAFWFVFSGGLLAQESPPAPGTALVQRLISMEEEIREDTISVAIVQAGEFACEDMFVCQHAARATVIYPINEKGRRPRRVQKKIFFWNEEWGWFSSQELVLRGAETIRIFSEKKGIIDVR